MRVQWSKVARAENSTATGVLISLAYGGKVAGGNPITLVIDDPFDRTARSVMFLSWKDMTSHIEVIRWLGDRPGFIYDAVLDLCTKFGAKRKEIEEMAG